MYKNSQLSLENINADKEIKTKVRRVAQGFPTSTCLQSTRFTPRKKMKLNLFLRRCRNAYQRTEVGRAAPVKVKADRRDGP